MEKTAYILPLASCIYLIISCWWVRQFFRSGYDDRSRRSGHVPGGGGLQGSTLGSKQRFTPPVSLLKPVRGLDQGAYDNFASFCRQDYPEFEVLFATDTDDDPAIPVIEQITRDFPAAHVRRLLTPIRTTPNPKASCLAALTEAAAHQFLVMSDSDMRVGPDYLRRVVSPLADLEIGLVTSCYRGVKPVTFTAKLEALYMGVSFLPQVVVARRFLDMRFALGATMALRAADLAECGGWEAAGHYLAEDTRVAQQMTALGKKVVLSDYIVDGYLGPTTWRDQWNREVRWARTNRGNQPRKYAGLILTLALPLALILLPLDPVGIVGWSVVAAALAVRWLTAWLVTGYTGNRALRRWLPWLPLRDMLSGLIWCAGAAGSRVVWRGRVHRVGRNGLLVQTDVDICPSVCSDASLQVSSGGQLDEGRVADLGTGVIEGEAPRE